jgi:hypothetical protein
VGNIVQSSPSEQSSKWLAFESLAAEGSEVKPALVQIVDQEVMSPMAYETYGGFLGTIPVLLFDESISSSGFHDHDEMDAEVLMSYVRQFRHQFATLKVKWARAFTELDASFGLVTQDLQRLQQASSTLVTSVGHLGNVQGMIGATVWEGLAKVHETIKSVSSSVATHRNVLDTIGVQHADVSQNLMHLESVTEDNHATLTLAINSVAENVKALESRFLKLLPVLTQLRKQAALPSNVGGVHLQGWGYLLIKIWCNVSMTVKTWLTP